MAECDPGRRRFLAISGGCIAGTLLAFNLTEAQGSSDTSLPPDGWIQIRPDGRVVLLVAKAEMGQGVSTALPMLLAEELDVPWEQVLIEQAPINPSKYDHLTVGSHSIESLWLPLRRAGAAARKLLIGAAARRWDVPVEACHTNRGWVIGPGSQRLGYAALVAECSFLQPSDSNVELRSVDQFRIVGRPRRRIDAAGKVTGSAIYGIDVQVPGMLRAVILRCPTPGGRLISFDRSTAMSVRGVKTVFPVSAQGGDAHTRGGIAVVADDSWSALKGRRALNALWGSDPSMEVSSASIKRVLLHHIERAGMVVAEHGDLQGAFRNGVRKIQATFNLPFVAHATMEPMNATVDVREEKVEAWLPTQNPADARAAIGRVLERDVRTITIHQTLLGGGFGRRDATDFVVEAAQVAAEVRRPVQLFWSREDDIQFDRYRPMAAHHLTAVLDAQGLPVGWLDRMSSTSIADFLEPSGQSKSADTEVGGARVLAYDIPAVRVEYTPALCPVPVGWWRSVEDSINAFAVECFIDDLAAATGRDPLEYRLALLPGDRKVQDREHLIECRRLRGVLAVVAALADWKSSAPPGRARGLACHTCRGSYIAVVVEISVRASEVRVHSIWAAADCGLVVNPLGLEAQIQGGLLFGLSAALYESITVKDGKVQQSNFNDYGLLRIDASPRVTVDLVRSTAAPTGAGEISVPPIAPALANAIYRISGRRPRSLPIIPTGD